MAQVIATDRLVKTFGRRRVVDEVSIRLDKGMVVGLLGPNGAGKTTTFYMVVGLVRPDAGRILLDGADITVLPMHRRARRGIGYLAQEDSIFRNLSVIDNLMAVLEFQVPDRVMREQRAKALLEEFGIPHLARQMGHSLSGGERRRVEIARALCSEPAYMLLDEPFAGVDPIAVADIQRIIAHLRDKGLGILITDHNVRETLKITDRAYVMNEGRILVEGGVDEITRNPQARRIYLGESFTMEPALPARTGVSGAR